MLVTDKYKIKWRHSVNTDSSHKMDGLPKTKHRGETLCIISDTLDKTLSWDIAVCVWEDNFSYDKGRKISLAKAILSIPKEERESIWEAYCLNMTAKPRW